MIGLTLLFSTTLLLALNVRPGKATTGKENLCRNEIVVEAPAAFLFPYISQGNKISQWSMDDKLEISFPKGVEARVGMQIKFLIKLPTTPSWVVEITKLEGGREMRTAIIEGIFRGGISFMTEPQSDARTKLIHEATILPQGKFMEFAWKSVGRDIHRKKMDEIMVRIKKLVEKDYRDFQRGVK